MNTINEIEYSQLGTIYKNGIPYFQSLDDWLKFRKFLVAKSIKRNPDHFDINLAAYTPGETLNLLSKKEIIQWFTYLDSIQIPDEAEAVILVPCAASKPWFNHKNVNKSLLYKAYNHIIEDVKQGEFKNIYFLTISEPLGIIPQDRWFDFPKYDNPGLFKDDFLRTGLVKTDWEKIWLKSKHLLPFDNEAYEQCIYKLSCIIERTLSKIKVPIISFVDAKEHTTHGHMLDTVEKINPDIIIKRFLKKGQARTSPYEYIKDNINEQFCKNNKNMNDKELYEEIVNRMLPTPRTTSMIHMINIVFKNTFVEIENAFNDTGVDQIFKTDSLTANAYKYFRDHQHLYIDDNLISSNKIDEILNKSSDEAIEYLEKQKYCDKEYQMLLNQAVYRTKIPLISYFLDKGVLPNTAFFIHSLLNEEKYLPSLIEIESKGLDLLSLSSGNLLHTSILNNNILGTDFLLKNAHIDMYIIRSTIKKYIYQEYEEKSKFQETKNKFQEISENMIPMIQLLFDKLSKQSISNIINNCLTEEMKDFLKEQELVNSLENKLPLKGNKGIKKKL